MPCESPGSITYFNPLFFQFQMKGITNSIRRNFIRIARTDKGANHVEFPLNVGRNAKCDYIESAPEARASTRKPADRQKIHAQF